MAARKPKKMKAGSTKSGAKRKTALRIKDAKRAVPERSAPLPVLRDR